MSPRLYHYYHVYADGQWRDPLAEHLTELEKSGLLSSLDGIYVGIIGKDCNCREVRQLVPDWVDVCAAKGWEQLTLQRLHAHAQSMDDDRVLYAHTKGAAFPTKVNQRWRRTMIEVVVGRWREAVELLETHDVAGPHWLAPEDWPDHKFPTPFFGGNFWWATARYLRTLPPLGMESRYEAERWIGLANPVAANMRPGWPGS